MNEDARIKIFYDYPLYHGGFGLTNWASCYFNCKCNHHIINTININTATNAELETLPGIGPVLAQRIIDDRVANGPYRDITDLARVHGISDTLIDEIRTQITVGP